MSDHARIEELRRRVQRDPASIAFAQLAEEHRRAGQLQEAIDVARAGLVQHPAYLSARVTLGRALLELGQLDEAAAEFEYVVQAAPDNLTAVRQLAEIHQKRRHLTNETKSRMPEVPPLASSPTSVARPVPLTPASSAATTSDTANQQINTAKQEVSTAKQEVNTAKQEIHTAQQPPSPPPLFVVELTSQTAHIATASPLTSPTVPAVPPSAPPLGATSPPAAAASVTQDIAKPPAPAPLDPVIAELEAWLAVLEAERAARAQSPHASR